MLHKYLSKVTVRNASAEPALICHGNGPGLLGYNDYNRIALLAHTNGCSVTCSELAADIVIRCQRKYTACSANSAVAENRGTVMERCARIKNVTYHFG